MIRYFTKHLKKLPQCDQADCQMFPVHKAEQAVPDYANEVYHHLRSQECHEVVKMQFQLQGLMLSKGGPAAASVQESCKFSSVVTLAERDRCARRVLELCKEKGYRLETWLLAINILDRFLATADSRYLSSENKAAQIPIIITAVVIMAAKLE